MWRLSVVKPRQLHSTKINSPLEAVTKPTTAGVISAVIPTDEKTMKTLEVSFLSDNPYPTIAAQGQYDTFPLQKSYEKDLLK